MLFIGWQGRWENSRGILSHAQFVTTSFVVAVLKMNIVDVMRSCARLVLVITCTFVQLVLSIAATLVIHPPNVVTLVAFTAIVVKSVRHARDLENQRTNYQVTC